MNEGSLQQVDTPEQVYRRPANRFVAGFIGSPAMNLVNARLTRTNGNLTVRFGEHSLEIDDAVIAERPALLAYEGKDVILGIRPEDLEDAAFAPGKANERTIVTVASLRETLGSEVLVHFPLAEPAELATDAGELIEPLGDASSIFVARIHPETTVREGDPLTLVVDTRRLHFFEPESGLAIYGGGDQNGRVPVGAASALDMDAARSS
jgi:multiple sugar transport system ATP-binding protein